MLQPQVATSTQNIPRICRLCCNVATFWGVSPYLPFPLLPSLLIPFLLAFSKVNSRRQWMNHPPQARQSGAVRSYSAYPRFQLQPSTFPPATHCDSLRVTWSKFDLQTPFQITIPGCRHLHPSPPNSQPSPVLPLLRPTHSSSPHSASFILHWRSPSPPKLLPGKSHSTQNNP